MWKFNDRRYRQPNELYHYGVKGMKWDSEKLKNFYNMNDYYNKQKSNRIGKRMNNYYTKRALQNAGNILNGTYVKQKRQAEATNRIVNPMNEYYTKMRQNQQRTIAQRQANAVTKGNRMPDYYNKKQARTAIKEKRLKELLDRANRQKMRGGSGGKGGLIRPKRGAGF